MTIDTSALIDLWAQYPREVPVLEPVWTGIEDMLKEELLAIPQVAIEELGEKSKELLAWVKKIGPLILEVDDTVLTHAKSIKKELGIVGEVYGGGVSANDILIIATAKAYSRTLVSSEKPKLNPELGKNFKIPNVCKLKSVSVEHVNLIGLFKKIGMK